MENFRSPPEHRGGGEGRPELTRTRRVGVLKVPTGWFGRKGNNAAGSGGMRKPTKLLLKVSLQNSVGPVQVVMTSENTVSELKKAVVEIYVREKRRPFLACPDPRCFVLHYSQYNLEGLKPEEKLESLGSRNFYLCHKPRSANITLNTQFHAVDKSPFGTLPLVKLMDFLL